MANVFGIHSVGDSVVTYLKDSYPEPLRSEYPCEFRLISSADLEDTDDIDTAVMFYLYRIVPDIHTRNRPQIHNHAKSPYPLSVCLNYLLIIWADNPIAEHTIASWVMLQLHQYPQLDNSMLSINAQWGPHDQLQIVPLELSNEDLFRLWDSLAPNYRLSIPYTIRVIRIEPTVTTVVGKPVVAIRHQEGEVE